MRIVAVCAALPLGMLALALHGGQEKTYSAVCAPAPAAWERTALKELCDYLGKSVPSGIIGVKGHGAAVFHVGDTEFARRKGLGTNDMDDEEWVVRSFGRDIVLNGGGTRGCLYAVYHFLQDQCGVRWWTDDEEDVPVRSELLLPQLDRSGRPAFAYRDVYRFPGCDFRTAVRNFLNGNGDVKIPASWGGGLEYGAPYHCHTWDRHVPFAKYGSAHPEWFSLRDGVRVGGAREGQLCLANPELKAFFTKRVLDAIEESRATAAREGRMAPRLFDVSMNDNHAFCQCPACSAETAAYGHSGRQIRFVNAVAEAVSASHPDIFLTTLAYFHSEEPPKGGVHAAKNVVVKFCNTQANMAAPFAEPSNAFAWNMPVRWKDHADSLFVWDYAVTYTRETRGFPFPSEFHMQGKFAHYAANGVRGVFIEHEQPDAADMYALKFYMERKLLENPAQDGKRLVGDFMYEYYGAVAGKIIHGIRESLERARERGHGYVTWEPPSGEFNFIDHDCLADALRAFDAAEKAVKRDEKRLRRVRRARLGFDLLAEQRRFEGPLKPREKGVSDSPFYDYPASMRTYNTFHGLTGIVITNDCESANGVAVKMPVTDKVLKHAKLPFHFGLYDTRNKKTVKAVNFAKPHGKGYSWYSLGEVELPPTGFYIYVTRGWELKIMAANPDLGRGTFEPRLHVRFTGPVFNPGESGESAIWIDRAIFVKRDRRRK